MTTVRIKVTTPTGTPVAKAQVDITLTEPGIDYLGEGLVLPTTTKGLTDAYGLFITELAAVDTAPYIAVIYDPKTNRKGVYEFFVPENEEIVDIADLALLPKPSGVSYDSASISQITSDRIRAEQAAEKALNATSPRYNVFNLPFIDIGGSQQATLSLEQSNGFVIVDEELGTIIVPEDNLENPAQNFDIGTAIIFIKGKVFGEIDVTFQPINTNVRLESLTIGANKLRTKSDVISLVKVADNTWKIYNIGGSGSGTSQGSVDTIFADIAQNTDDIAQLESWRTAFNSQLNVLTSDVNANVNSIALINSSISALVPLVTNINAVIDEKVTAAIPDLGDISAYVNAAQSAQISASASADAAFGSEQSSSVSADAAATSASAANDSAIAANDSAVAASVSEANTAALADTVADISAVGVEGLLPSGMIAPFAMTSVPPGWLHCRGQLVDSNDYPNLYAAIGTTFGSGSGSLFRLPDLRGEFLRGWNDTTNGKDAGRIFGSTQNFRTEEHFLKMDHRGSLDFFFRTVTDVPGWVANTYAEDTDGDGSRSDSTTRTRGIAIGTYGDKETRPTNIALKFCIKT